MHETRARICRDVAEITFFPCVLDDFTKATVLFGSCVWFGPALEQKLQKAAVEAPYLTRSRVKLQSHAEVQ